MAKRRYIQAINDALVEEMERDPRIVLGRIQLGQNNDPLLNMLSNTIGMNIASIKELLNQFEKRMDREKESRKKILEEELRKRGVSGSAVIPNLNADEKWLRTVSELNQLFREKIKGL